MLTSLKIENFRGFREFEIDSLTRINLLVGVNNSGKTSILEAIQLLYSSSDLRPLTDLMIYRGEYRWTENNIRGGGVSRQRELDISHLFYGHEITQESNFLITGKDSYKNQDEQQKIHASIEKRIFDKDNFKNQEIQIFDDATNSFEQLYFIVRSPQYIIHPPDKPSLTLVPQFPLSSDGYISINLLPNRYNQTVTETELITPFSLTPKDLTILFDEIVLTPDETLIIEALQIIEPTIERIASIDKHKYRSSILGEKGGFLVKFANQKHPVPIGSLGDGIWRLLGIILAMVNVKNGILLIDEIDTGLHFTTMSNMWKLIWNTAKKLNIQVFATTHNSDCWSSLADLITSENIEDNEISIHRIKQNQTSSVVFNQREIVIAAQRGIEVR